MDNPPNMRFRESDLIQVSSERINDVYVNFQKNYQNITELLNKCKGK